MESTTLPEESSALRSDGEVPEESSAMRSGGDVPAGLGALQIFGGLAVAGAILTNPFLGFLGFSAGMVQEAQLGSLSEGGHNSAVAL
jgi:hypothetical protein